MGPAGEELFVSGRQLSLALYEGYVAPALAARLPGLRHAAALIGHGSDVVGFDDFRSTDHDWGPRLQILVADDELESAGPAVLEAVEQVLPDTVGGVPVRLAGVVDLPGEPGMPRRRHGVEVTTVGRLSLNLLGTDDDPRNWGVARWLTTPRQNLLEFTAGPVHRDGIGELSAARAALAWYPHDLWLYVMSGRWQRIAQIEPFVGRAAEAGNELGSRVLVSQIADEVMHLSLLQEHVYPPYPKWLGTAFAVHEEHGQLEEALGTALSATATAERQEALVAALLELSRRHDALAVTPPVRSRAEMFFGRPYPVIWAERIARALHDAIGQQLAVTLPYGLGGIDEVTNATDALKSLRFRRSVAAVYA